MLPPFLNSRGFSRGSRVKFAPPPSSQNQRLVNLSPVDENGRPIHGVEYSHGRKEEITYQPNTGNGDYHLHIQLWNSLLCSLIRVLKMILIIIKLANLLPDTYKT